ncbi:hypothetical protein [Caldinitratiruptor microaerophilus]|uniref:Flp pilus-assembly TadE/G-like n=1 Tax=Caldinitratiruptor microaerophilus TaxID=671077 RepID=A0AA35CMB7_9FIRM|nr:hypothetical protein [Caldinitratiruptor microaerophilus]BDG59935.1 hypothetical protein caldi_10250 [Caldinitratiruptor microaerophilus]
MKGGEGSRGAAGAALLAAAGLLVFLGSASLDLLAVHAAHRQAQAAADAAALGSARALGAAWRSEIDRMGGSPSPADRYGAACRTLRSGWALARSRAAAWLATGGARLDRLRLTPDGRVEVRASVALPLRLAGPLRVRVPAAAAARPVLDGVTFPRCRR